MCWLLGIRSASELRQHHQRGAVFESWVVSEVIKAHLHLGLVPRLAHYRGVAGHEVDLVVEAGPRWRLVDAKSGQTIAADSDLAVRRLGDVLGRGSPPVLGEPIVVFAGARGHTRGDVTILPWHEVAGFDWARASAES